MLRTPVTHVFTHFRSLGGVESVLRRLAARDATHAPGSRTISLFERGPFAPNTVSGLGLSGLSTPAGARRRLHAAVNRNPRRGLWVYHNGWGAPFLAGADDADRRLAVLHSDWPGLGSWLAQQRGRFDGLLAVSNPLLELAGHHLALPPERLGWLPYPIDPPIKPAPQRPDHESRPLVVGYCGRVTGEQKRVDRLPGLATRLQATGLDVRWEILGDGPHRGQLAAGLPPGSVFHGRRSGPDYWRALEQWDVMVFTSDYEGLPISLLEGFFCGTLAVFPRIGSGGDEYVGRIARELLYMPGDLDDAARALRWLASLPGDRIEDLRRRAQLLANFHAGDAFERAFDGHLEAIGRLPRISAAGKRADRTPWAWRLPFALLRRLPATSAWRQGLL